MRKISLILLATLMSHIAFAEKKHGDPPTWSESVACIIYSHCSGCHNPKGIAPFSLMNYQEAFNERFSIRYSVLSRSMPPWLPDSSLRGQFAHERTLTTEEVHAILDWVDGGALQGDPAKAPAAPVISTASELKNPDLTLTIPNFTNKATEDVYRCFVLPTGLTGVNNITAWEVLPGDYSMVHHVQIFQDTSSVPLTLDAADPEPGYISFGSTGSKASKLIGVWTPGSGPYYFPANFGASVDPGARIILQIHYSPGSQGKSDSTKINLKLTKSSVRHVQYAPVLNHEKTMVNGPLFIPADSVKTFYEEFKVPIEATTITVFPHMHLLGKKIKAYAVTPAKDTFVFIDIPDWDFHWQGNYNLRQLRSFPVNTTLYAEATFDNTSNNIHNPNFPPKDVYVGEKTTDEMFLVYFGFAFPAQPGDKNIITDSSDHMKHHNDCVGATGNVKTPLLLPIKIYPNPANNQIFIEMENQRIETISVTDIHGRQIFVTTSVEGERISINTSEFASGLYFISIYAGGERQVHKIYID